jgi:hypothetical protein
MTTRNRPSMMPGGEQVGAMSARRWRSMERKARADHERYLLSTIGQLAASGARVALDEPLRRRARRPGVIVVRGAGWQLALVGTSPLADGVASDHGRLWHVAGAGRYGSYWWLHLADGEDSAGHQVSILAFHLRFDGATGGAEIQPATPLGHAHRNW